MVNHPNRYKRTSIVANTPEHFRSAAEAAGDLTHRLKDINVNNGLSGPVSYTEIYEMTCCIEALGRAIAAAMADLMQARDEAAEDAATTDAGRAALGANP